MTGAVIVKVALRGAMDYLTQRGIGHERGAAECCRESEGVPQTPFFLAPKSGGKGVDETQSGVLWDGGPDLSALLAL